MILSQIRAYLQQRGQASLADLTLHFNSQPDAMRGMLEQWIRRGKVHKTTTSPACGGCTRCDPLSTEIYAWTERDS